MLPIFWQKCAQKDLEKIINYIADINPRAARELYELIKNAVLPVSEHPYMYKESSRKKGYREIIAHPNYIIYYQVTNHAILIKNIMHARRHFP